MKLKCNGTQVERGGTTATRKEDQVEDSSAFNSSSISLNLAICSRNSCVDDRVRNRALAAAAATAAASGNAVTSAACTGPAQSISGVEFLLMRGVCVLVVVLVFVQVCVSPFAFPLFKSDIRVWAPLPPPAAPPHPLGASLPIAPSTQSCPPQLTYFSFRVPRNWECMRRILAFIMPYTNGLNAEAPE